MLRSLTKDTGVVRVVFATTELGMGVNCIGLYSKIHYGAPRSIDDYFQESGRAGRDGKQASSTTGFLQMLQTKGISRNAEIVVVRQYYSDCR